MWWRGQALNELLEVTRSDVRACLNALQFLARKTRRVTLASIKALGLASKDVSESAFTAWNQLFTKRVAFPHPSILRKHRNEPRCPVYPSMLRGHRNEPRSPEYPSCNPSPAAQSTLIAILAPRPREPLLLSCLKVG